MKAFIFDPLWDELVTPELSDQLQEAGVEIVVNKAIAPLSDCKELFEGDEPRMLCVNPDSIDWKLSADDYKDIPMLKAILSSVTSFEWIDTSYANDHNIPVCNIRDYSTNAVAEWAITVTLSLARQIPRLIKDGFPLDFTNDFMKYRGIELHGKTAGIIGMGHIGQAIAKRCAGLGMNVIYWSRNSRVDDYQYEELSTVMAEADVIYPILSKNDETQLLFTQELLNSIKPTAIVVCEVGGLVDQELLASKVKDGKLFGLGFEVDGPGEFAEYEGNVWAAPAYGWATDGSMQNAIQQWAENMINSTKNEFPNRVN